MFQGFINIAQEIRLGCYPIFSKHIRLIRLIRLIRWRETLSTFQEQTLQKLFHFFYVKMKTENYKLIYALKSGHSIKSCKISMKFPDIRYVKSVQIRSFFWSVFSRIQTRKNSVLGHFLCSDFWPTSSFNCKRR